MLTGGGKQFDKVLENTVYGTVTRPIGATSGREGKVGLRMCVRWCLCAWKERFMLICIEVIEGCRKSFLYANKVQACIERLLGTFCEALQRESGVFVMLSTP